MNTMTEIQTANAARANRAGVAINHLLVKLGLLAAAWALPGFGQLGELPRLQPCAPADALAQDILSNSPNHGSGPVKCGKAKVFYGSEKTAHAVTVEIESGKKCKAVLVKNVKIEGKQVTGGKDVAEVSPNEDGEAESFTATASDVDNLMLKCEGRDATDACKFRITQITEDAPVPAIPPKK